MSLSDVIYDGSAYTSRSDMEFLSLQADDTGFFKCTVQYTYGAYTDVFSSTVGEIYIVSFALDLTTGGSFNKNESTSMFSVSTLGPNEPIKFTWESQLAGESDYKKISADSDTLSRSITKVYNPATLEAYSYLNFSTVIPAQRGSYKVTASYEQNSQNIDITSNVRYFDVVETAINISATTIADNSGAKFTITCNYTSGTKPVFALMKENSLTGLYSVVTGSNYAVSST